MEERMMRKKKFNKMLTIALSEELFTHIKNETDIQQISFAEWFRDAAELKIQIDSQGNQKEGNENEEKKSK
jgi:hypothetical protein